MQAKGLVHTDSASPECPATWAVTSLRAVIPGVHGVFFISFFNGSRFGENADVQVTWISYCLEVASEVLADWWLPMLAHLRCVLDNESGETKTIRRVYGCVGWWLAAKC